MTITSDQLERFSDGSGAVVSSDGDKIGNIGQIYVDDTTGEPSWVTVKTGLFGTSESFVPLQGASLSGDDVVVGFDKDRVKGAPRVDADSALSPAEEDQLYTYYGMGGASSSAGDSGYTDGSAGRSTYDDGADRTAQDGSADRSDYDAGADTVGRDTSGPTTDSAMTRSEERLNVGTETRETGKARLRKYVVTENGTQTVPDRREEVRIEREPITDENRGAAGSGPDISEEEHEVTLHEERPVVDKDVVAVERVRVDTDTVTEEATVSDEVRKENIDLDTDDRATDTDDRATDTDDRATDTDGRATDTDGRNRN